MADEGKKGSMWTGVAIGCGGLILLAIVGSCVGPSIFAMMMMDGLGGMGPMGLGATNPTVAPGTAGLELPPPPGPLMPVGNSGTAGLEVTKVFTLAITEVTGVEGLAAGDECPFEVQRVPRGSGGYWCRTELRCADQVLYGGPGQGYFDCTFPDDPYQHLEAYDYGMQEEDGDPSFNIGYDGVVTIRNMVSGVSTQVIGNLREGGTMPVPEPAPAAQEEPTPAPQEP